MIDNFLKYIQYEKRYSMHTVTAYQDDLHKFFDFLSATFDIRQVDDIQHAHLRSWIVQLVEQGNHPHTVNRKIATLKSFFKFLQARQNISQNPASRLRPLKSEKKLPSFVRENEMTVLLDQIPYSDDFFGSRDKMLIELLYATGIRLTELVNIRHLDINYHDHSIKVLGKRNKERIIPVHDSVVILIRKYMKQKKEMWEDTSNGFLLVTDKGQKMYPMMVYRLINKYLGLVTTLSKKSPHVLRHTFATHLLNKGADLNAVKDLLGHTSLAATQVYTHNSLEKLKSVFDQAHPKA
ncbi:MAG: tyrosine-type recombinase/integrase [Cyclobacteriaceae bacterium]|nr:tyrosine-type recombinase/integrase [Cyclobacteriaceae bacterium]